MIAWTWNPVPDEGNVDPVKTALKILQFCLAILLLTTSIGKLLDVRGFAEVLVTYDLFPEGTLFPIALVLSLVELLLSLWLFSGIELRFAALAATLLNLIFTVVAVISNLRGLDIPNCGCFGVFWAQPLTWLTVVEDLVLTALCVLLFLLARRLPGEVWTAPESAPSQRVP